MENRFQAFLDSEDNYGYQLVDAYEKILKLFNEDRSNELKLLHEYFEIQIKSPLKYSKEFKDIIDIYYKQMFYFDIMVIAILCSPYIKREMKDKKVPWKEETDTEDLLKNIEGNMDSYEQYFQSTLRLFQLEETESMKLATLLSYVKEKQKEIKAKLQLGFIINEIITWEEAFIQKLSRLVKIFEQDHRISKEITTSKNSILLGQMQFRNDLKSCNWDCDVNSIITCFQNHIELFKLYAKDQRLMTGEKINTLPDDFSRELKKHDVKLHMCTTHLLSYNQFLDKMEKLEPDSKHDISDVKQRIKGVSQQADDNFAIANIVRCNIHKDHIGSFISRGRATLLRKGDHEIFLFEDALIIAEIPQKKTQDNFKHLHESTGTNPVIYYKDHILREYVQIIDTGDKKVEIKKNLCPKPEDQESISFTIDDLHFKSHLLDYPISK